MIWNYNCGPVNASVSCPGQWGIGGKGGGGLKSKWGVWGYLTAPISP